ncbi:diguanylate cyclase [Jiella sp. KSK16Y-1]|uniref:Diguanylate cyclase n=1 Tax=Jiella mangrovi TaxID=2821407 RepID=A0ABS4BCK1_9HYPH|nr:diguanylate cyclase [Jiella mangrovi]
MIEFFPDGHISFANENFLKLMEYQEGEVIGQHHSMFLKPMDRDHPHYRAFWELLRSGEFVRREFCRVAKSGREVWLQASYNPVIDDQGRVRSIVKIATDITADRQRSATHQSTLEAISRSTIMVEYTLDGTILSANAKFAALMGYDVQDLLGRNHCSLVPSAGAAGPAYRTFWNRLRSGESVEDEFAYVSRSGCRIWLKASYNPILDASGHPCSVMMIATDITDRLEQNAESERLALIDQLTGVSNRRGFDLALAATTSERASRPEPVSLLILDVDNFKAFNDSYGHQVGDRCLQVIARAVELAVQQHPNGLVARYGGEEFAVILSDTGPLEALRIADDVRTKIAELAIGHPGNTGWGIVTASIGSATLVKAQRQGTAKDLVAAADAALYEAKRSGRNRTVAAATFGEESQVEPAS